ncbi:lambda-exonuclease family protein [Cryobacterium sp. GrIS_2_6]|uniref:YqaJ viral recombinase family nuclease n=1 Tax=Cryobacterium sp. GrIS_2_6 TaxID=3162785 RepID=UPI002E09EB40|nr:putative phage-type endonuclease [Cryobacterium psychrotolerans]MEC5149269.1 putative phage-type endonuclease [Cryobacterium psychrotolerans]MEC5149348.1 putative phage-type endonuclease [Cryobacterium psychrotolerans]
MTAYRILTATANTPEWLTLRKSIIGASEVACILGLSHYSTPLGIYLDKLNPNVTDDMTEWQEWGHRLEDAIATWVADKKGLTVLPSPGLLQSTEYPWLGATPDRVTDLGEPLELKTSDRFMADAWADGVPDNYLIQVFVQMIVLGARRGYLAVLHGGNRPEFYVIEWDQQVVDQIISITKDFWQNNVMAKTPPEPTTSEELALTHRDSGETLDGDERLLMAWYLDGQERSAYKEADARIESVKAAYKELLNVTNKSVLAYQGKALYTWKRPKPTTSFDMALFKAEHPALVDMYTREHPAAPRFLRKDTKALNEEFATDPPEGWEAGLTVSDVLSDYGELTIWKKEQKAHND